MEKPKIIVILGPTATGKSDLAVKIAKKIKGLKHGHTVFGQGEIISADSRQVYKGLNIGTGKISKKEMRGVPHYLLDVISPNKIFSVSEWKKLAEEKIMDIIARGKTPIIVGGTGFYIQSIVDNIILPEVPPNKNLRKKLTKVRPSQLFSILKKLDPGRAREIAKEKGSKNPVRLIRAIEIATTLGKVPSLNSRRQSSGRLDEYEFLQIGLTASPEILRKRIHIRLLARIRRGMIGEARKLHKNGLSYKRMRGLGLEYRYLADFLEDLPSYKATARQRKILKMKLISKLDREIYQYAKRQMTWFKRDKKIQWFDVGEKRIKEKEILGKVMKMLS